MPPRLPATEEKAAEVYRTYTKQFADEQRTDSHGNVFAILNPGAWHRIMLSGHSMKSVLSSSM